MWRTLLAAAAVLLASDLAAGEAENPPPQGERATPSAWEALRRDAAARGVELSAVYDGEGLVNATGGTRTGGVYVGNLHLQLTVDAERLLGWRGLTLFLNGLVTHGGHPSDLVGDAQG
jgi:porin